MARISQLLAGRREIVRLGCEQLPGHFMLASSLVRGCFPNKLDLLGEVACSCYRGASGLCECLSQQLYWVDKFHPPLMQQGCTIRPLPCLTCSSHAQECTQACATTLPRPRRHLGSYCWAGKGCCCCCCKSDANVQDETEAFGFYVCIEWKNTLAASWSQDFGRTMLISSLQVEYLDYCPLW